MSSCLVWIQSLEKVTKRLSSLLGTRGCLLKISQEIRGTSSKQQPNCRLKLALEWSPLDQDHYGPLHYPGVQLHLVSQLNSRCTNLEMIMRGDIIRIFKGPWRQLFPFKMEICLSKVEWLHPPSSSSCYTGSPVPPGPCHRQEGRRRPCTRPWQRGVRGSCTHLCARGRLRHLNF